MAKQKQEDTSILIDEQHDITPDTDAAAQAAKSDSVYESLPALADRHRVPTWQQAALCRLMGWTDGKVLKNTEYVDALDKLKTRRVGGGRMG